VRVPWEDAGVAETVEPAAPPAAAGGGDQGAASRTGMAAERTWLAWWRSALAASVGALGVGRLAPEVLDARPGPYIALGCGYAALAVGLLVVGAARQRNLQRAVAAGEQAPLPFWLVAMFTVGGTLLALLTVVLVIAQS
jgi:putative membrane protein